MITLKNKPFIFSFLIILTIYIINKLPLSNIFINSGFNEFNSNASENIIINCFVLLAIYLIIKNTNIPVKFIGKLINVPYYIPLIIFLFVFSGGGNNIGKFDLISIETLLVYGAETFSSAFLEELLFRGLILGLFLFKYNKSKNGIFKAVLFSSLIFGSIHFLNFWSQPGATLKGVFNQIYATACFGFMYGAVYLKTRNLFILAFFHSISNFIGGIGEIEAANVVENIVRNDPTLLNTIITEIIRLVIFGIPLLIGYFVYQRINKEDIEDMMKQA